MLRAEKDDAAMRVSSNLRPILSPNPALLSLLRYHHGTTSRDSRVAQISSRLLTHSAIRALGNQRAGWRLSPPMQCSTHASLASASILRRLLIGGEPLAGLVSREWIWMQELRAKVFPWLREPALRGSTNSFKGVIKSIPQKRCPSKLAKHDLCRTRSRPHS